MLYFSLTLIILYLMCSFILGRPFESTDHKSASQLDSYRLRTLHHVLSTKRLVRMATCIYQSAYRVHNRTRGDKREDGKRRGRQDGRDLLWQSSTTLGCIRGRNQDQCRYIQLECARGISLLHRQPVGRVVADRKNRCMARDDSSLADTRRSAHPVIRHSRVFSSIRL